MIGSTDFFAVIPWYLYIINGTAFFFLFIILAFYGITRKKVRTSILSGIEQFDSASDRFPVKLNRFMLLLHSGSIEKMSHIHGLNLPRLLRLDNLWIERLGSRTGGGVIGKILEFSPEKGLFPVFLSVLERPKRYRVFKQWIESGGELFLVRKIAVSGRGRKFNGLKAFQLFPEFLSELLEMTGAPEWEARFFAMNILMHSNEKHIVKAVWDAFKDPSSEIRKTIVTEFIVQESEEDRNRLARVLTAALLNDPVFEVRKSARERLDRDFPDLFSIDTSKLSLIQKLHYSCHLNPKVKGDEQTALIFLQDKDLELSHNGARFLDKYGILERLLLSADPGDREGMDRIRNILSRAVQSGCTRYLESAGKSSGPGPLLLASEILCHDGKRNMISMLMEKVTPLPDKLKKTPPWKEVYLNIIRTACARGSDEALLLVAREMKEMENSASVQEMILNKIPAGKEHLFFETLLTFLNNPDYPVRETLIDHIASCPVSLLFPELLSILHNTAAPPEIKISAVKILARLNLPYAVQHLLENLHVLSPDEAQSLSGYLSDIDTPLFRSRAVDLLSSPDARVRTRLINALPRDKSSSFLPELKKALQESSPEVRIAAIRALSLTDGSKSPAVIYPYLRDPVEKVRRETARILGERGDDGSLKTLEQVIFDTNESTSVKEAAVEGLGLSPNLKSVELLIRGLSEENITEEKVIRALSKKEHSEEIKQLLITLENAGSRTRDAALRAVKMMGETAERFLELIVFDDENPLRKQAVSILEETGALRKKIRQLSHRDPIMRREAASFLAKAGTISAYRGIVMAARDPDEEVRVQVVKALEALHSEKGKQILEELMNDPEKRIRRYTLWAIERFEAKNLEE